MRFLLSIWSLAALAAAPTQAGDLETLVSWMAGSFSSAAQAAADKDYFDIRLEVVPIWTEREDGRWLYVEQAAADSLERPYRQRVYRLTSGSDGTLQSEVFEIPEPLRFTGAWKSPASFADLKPESLALRTGCTVTLRKNEDQAFVGGTQGTNCASTLRGAAHAVSKVTVLRDRIETLDQGFAASGEQVWGARGGPYLFVRQERREGP